MEKLQETLELMNRLGQIGVIPNDISEIEKKVIRLTEERGVAGSPYVSTIKTICKYIKDYCHTIGYINVHRTITIPYEIVKEIDFIDTLNLTIDIYNTNDTSLLNNSGGGVTNFKMNNKIVNNKINSVSMTIKCYSFMGMLIERTVYNSLYHEINHCYDAYNDLKSNNYYYRFSKQGKKSHVPVDIFEDYLSNKLFRLILYRLFSETEFNALIASVYGDLEGINSKRENFANDIKNTQAYDIYVTISKNYKLLYKKINDENITKIKELFNEYEIHLNPYNNSTESFVKELSRKTNFLLKQLIKGIGRTASLYYDNQEVTVPPTEITIK